MTERRAYRAAQLHAALLNRQRPLPLTRPRSRKDEVRIGSPDTMPTCNIVASLANLLQPHGNVGAEPGPWPQHSCWAGYPPHASGGCWPPHRQSPCPAPRRSLAASNALNIIRRFLSRRVRPEVAEVVPSCVRSVHPLEPETGTRGSANWATAARRCNRVSSRFTKRWLSPARERSVCAAGYRSQAR